MALTLDFQPLTPNLTPSRNQISGSSFTPDPSSSQSHLVLALPPWGSSQPHTLISPVLPPRLWEADWGQ